MSKYLHPSDEAAAAFFSTQQQGEIVMLNMLKFNDIADYSETPELASGDKISGEEAYQLYMQHTQPFLAENGGEMIFFGASGSFLIGPADEKWDVIMLIKQESIHSFMAFASNEAYLAGLGHRTAALADSRLLPITPKS